MKIAIYDIIHIEQVLPLIKVSRHLELDLVLFTNETFRNDLMQRYPDLRDKMQVWFKPVDQSEYAFMQLAAHEVRKSQARIFLLNSIDSKHLLWCRIMQSLPGVIFLNTLHEINNLFTDITTLHPKKFIRQWGKKKFRNRVDGFTLNTSALLENLNSRRLTDKKSWLFPQAIFQEDNLSYPEDVTELKIVLPGTIDGRRRNYEFALDVYTMLLDKNDDVPELYIAGPPMGDYGKMIIDRAIGINARGGKIHYSDRIIPEDEFDRIVNESHLLWSPQVLDTSINDGIQERYGETKNSGNTHVAIRFARPMLIPQQMKTALPDQKSVIYFSDEENCAEVISSLMKNMPALSALHNEALKESRNFSVEAVAEKFREIIKFYQ